MGRDIDTRQYGQEYADSLLHTPGMSRCEHENYACIYCATKYAKKEKTDDN